ncbi:cytosine deaminase [Phormidium sp. CLA17]|uniref:cytosine deaminase n=1 Tax=Leptolyngbya sp. Cla-17 TaxID=2803751 RepID=UPI001491B701|nr:cytosine deaminase [Leptolyngbya sp. Cla-17]MBM0742052.1 cytosine deaminase [Leptolyngbya sp. Cla-17]
MIPKTDHYWLRNAHVPDSLMVHSDRSSLPEAVVQDELRLVDIEIANGAIASIVTAETQPTSAYPSVDLKGGMVFPCFVDMHTHLDKGHLWERSPNVTGTFADGLETIRQDSEHWNAEDVYRRMEFGLKCSYAHGTRAVRTHLDSGGNLAEVTLEAFRALRDRWADRISLQAVCLVSLEDFLTPQGEKLADQIAEMDGILGGFASMNPEIELQIDRTFEIARDRNLDLDLHVDENNDPNSICLKIVAETALRQQFQKQIVCGHCCSLAVQPTEESAKTIDLVKQANIGIVSLPMCNLYLQDRKPGHTPHWRGVTLLHELKQAGVPVAIASDNCRDPFHAFGDHDALEVFALSAKIAHLDRPYGDWCRAITLTPADLMGLPTTGRLDIGLTADLVLFKARRYSELLSRSQHDRVVLRNGIAIDTALPNYAELDDLQTSHQ